MRRRTILGILSLTLLLGGLALGQDLRPDRQIAVTFDDLPFGGPEPPAEIQTLYSRITSPPK
jgi:peptidoglycan/xylan/chitin deacetylase (PgdA/CDA1 family)